MNANTKPQHDLAAGILSQARRDLRRFHGATRTVERELYFDAYDWVVSDDCRWPFSFRNVCQFLELSPESVRQELFRDISLGAIHYWTRSFGRVVRHFQISLCHFFTREHAAGPLVSGTLAPTVS